MVNRHQSYNFVDKSGNPRYSDEIAFKSCLKKPPTLISYGTP